MKRLPLLTLLFLSTLCFILYTYAHIPVSAQKEVFDFNRAHSDYMFTYGQYRLAHADYVAARQAYLNYKTLTSKTEAQNQTLRTLTSRDEVVRTYLTALRMKLAETTGISNYEQNILYLKLDDEVNWHADHRDALPSAGTLEDLVSSSKKAQNRYAKNTEVLIYQTLGTILGGKEAALREEINQQIKNLKDKVAEIRQRRDKDTTLLERWLLEAENRLTRSQEKQFAAQQLLANLQPYDILKNRKYNQSQYVLEESHQYLKEASFYLIELIREAKRGD